MYNSHPLPTVFLQQMRLNMLQSFVQKELTPKLPRTDLVAKPLSPLPLKPFMNSDNDCFCYSSPKPTAFGRPATSFARRGSILTTGNPTRSTFPQFRQPPAGSLKRKYSNGRSLDRNRPRGIELVEPTKPYPEEETISRPKQMKPNVVRTPAKSVYQSSHLWWPINERGRVSEDHLDTQVKDECKKPQINELSKSPSKSPTNDRHSLEENNSTPGHSSPTNSCLTSPRLSHSNNDSPKSIAGTDRSLLGLPSTERSRSHLDTIKRFTENFTSRIESLSYSKQPRNSSVKSTMDPVISADSRDPNKAANLYHSEQWLTKCNGKLSELKSLATVQGYRNLSTIPHPMTLLQAQMTLLQCQRNLADFIQRSYRGKSE